MPDRRRRLAEWLIPWATALVIGFGCFLGWLAADKGDGREVDLADEYALVLLAGALLAAWVGFHLHRRRAASFTFSRTTDMERTRPGLVAMLASTPRALRVVALAVLAFALARPQTYTKREIHAEGVDIMIVLDLSRSMEERDLDRRRNRLEVARQTIKNFLRGRKNDRIGLVVFAKQSLLQCPLTLDYSALDAIVSDVQIGDIDHHGTAIGDGVGLALASLRRSEARSKVIILLSDGDSNVTNVMTPEEARDRATREGVRIFTVLIGRELGAQGGRSTDPFGRQAHGVNPALLRSMADATRGRYFNAPNAAALDAGFEAVRKTLEKTKRKEIRRIPTELYAALVVPAFALLLLEIALGLTRFRRFP